MRTFEIIYFGISGTLIVGLVAFIASLQIESSTINGIVFMLFIVAPALSCILGGLSDYRIAAMIVVYTLVGIFFFGAARPGVAVGPSQREFYNATRHLAGDIGPWREIIGGCTLAIGRILFIRTPKETQTDSNSENA